MSESGCDLFVAQYDVISRITSFVSNFKKANKERINIGYLTTRSTGLEKLWEEFVINHKEIAVSSDSDTRSSQDYFKSNLYEKYEEIYFEISGRIAEHLNQLAASAIPSTIIAPSTAVQQANQQLQHVKIPPLNVPSFSGRYDEWTSFRDLFVAAVDSNKTLQPVHKLQYLKSLLKGDAETLLKNTPITNENYVTAWKTLEDRFENKRAIITSHLHKLFNQCPAEETATSIRKLVDSTKECINALKLQGIDTESWDSILCYMISQRIPQKTLDLWEQSLDRNELPKIDALLEFLEDRFRILELTPLQTQTQPNRRIKPQSFHTTTTTCRVCQGNQHPLRLCPKFLEMQTRQRLNHVIKAKLCKNCFAYSHPTNACQSSGRCNVCEQRHHSLLHIQSISTNPNNLNPKPNPFASSISTTNLQESTQGCSSSLTNTLMSRPTTSSEEESILATALVTVTSFDGKKHSFRALLDNASQECFISKRVVQYLGIKPKPTPMIVSGVGQAQAPKPLGQVTFSFGSLHDPSFSMEVDAIVLPIITYNLPSQSVHVRQQLISNLELADPTYGTPGCVDVLLSASIFAALTLPHVRKDSVSATIALQTKLGWVLYGEATRSSALQQRACFHVSTEEQISSALQAFWKIEELATVKVQSPEDAQCERIYAEKHSREPDGRYRVHLPFKNDDLPLLGSSRARAVSRFIQIERKLSTNKQLYDDYSKCINEYLRLGHMRPVSTSEEQHRVCLANGSFTYTSYYLPHHAVIKSDSTTTKVRVVFDASSKTLNGSSLNETLYIGPVLQDSLVNLLMRWRIHRIVLKADIEKMYRQVLVDKTQQSYQRIVWRNNPDEPLEDFQLRTVTFGTAAAPYLAIKTLYQLANDEESQYPIGAETIRQDFYVDDLLSGADNVAEAIEKQRQVIAILKCGGFPICKWSSNHKDVTDTIEETAKDVCNSPESTLKALGILWCPKSDVLSIRVSLLPTIVSTKRSLLSEVAKLFDPLGWIAPAIICMKILLQKLWLAGLTWDEPLPNNIKFEWDEFTRQLPSIEQIQINRWLKTSPHFPIELHGFCDASEKAYAAVIYIRVQTNHQKWSTHLITSKTRVAPVKQISLPRLELCAATLLAKLIVTINNSIKASKTHVWTDSEIVLAWLQGHPNRWTTFVSNRVSEIHNVVDANAWHHVPSKENPADCASRGISPQQLVQHPIWWHGPIWLSKEESFWPKKQKKEISPTTIECKKSQSYLTVPINDTLTQILNNSSSFSKAIRVTAYVRRWRSQTLSRGSLLSVEETGIAKTLLLRHVQQNCFPEEYAALSTNKPLSKKSTILSLNPFFDSDQLIRVGGRLGNAEIPYPAKHPIIIPNKSRLTELLIDETHIQTMHGGNALMLAHLRNQYWLINPRNAIRYRTHKCNTCFKFRNPALSQLMGNLPKPRVTVSHPFSHTGVDYAGPISIKLRRSPGRPLISKGYICLFVCLSTKAIHLELVGDMTATTFLAALNRFISRRGIPSDMYSDNGTYFVRAAYDINSDLQAIKRSHTQEAAKMVTQHAIQWHFIPPSAPHFGGLWEAGVKSTKNHLKRIIGDGTLTYEEMTTTLCQIECCLNSRPLCPISNDPNDFGILTPGHFLVGRPLLARPQPSVLELPLNRLHYWQRIYQGTEKFWRQWQSDYFSRLQQRPKWLTETNGIQKGELVLLKDNTLPPTQWAIGRIVETHPGADGLTRVVTVKTPSATLKRPIVKVCRLPSQ